MTARNDNSRDLMFGLDGDDRLLGGGGDDHLYGGSGIDVLAGGTGDDTLIGGADNDTIWGGELDATSGAGDGYDTVRYSDETTPVSVRFDGSGPAPGLVVTSAAAGTDTLHYIDQIVLTTGNDSFSFTGAIPAGYRLRIDANGGQTEDLVDLNGALGPNITATVLTSGVNLTSPGAAGGLIELVGFHTTILGSDHVRTTFVGAGTGAVFKAGAGGGDFTLLAGDQAYGREGVADIFRVTTTAPAGLTGAEKLDYLNNNRALISGIGAEDSVYVNGVLFDGNNVRSVQDELRFASRNHDVPAVIYRVSGDSSYGISSGSPAWVSEGTLYGGEYGYFDYAAGSIFRNVTLWQAETPGWNAILFNASTLRESYSQYLEGHVFTSPQLRLDEQLTVVIQGFQNDDAGIRFTTDAVANDDFYNQRTTPLTGYALTGGWGEYSPDNPVIDASDPAYNYAMTVPANSEADLLAYVGGADNLYAMESGELRGGRGNDRLFGQDGANQLFGGDGRDELDGGAGADALYGDAGDDALAGGDGDDRLAGGAGDDRIDGGAGYDTVSYEDSSVGVSVDLLTTERQNTSWGNDLIVGIEGLTGSAFADLLVGDDGANSLTGLSGDDEMSGRSGDDGLNGGSGSDKLRGDAGNDELTGGAGDDILDGGSGADTVIYSDAPHAVRVDLVLGGRQDTNWGWDQIVQVENLHGSSFDDLLVGSEDANVLFGGDGHDVMGGRSGDDRISGEQGNDTIYGDAGNDFAIGGAGNDFLHGGDGNDVMGGESGDDRLEGHAGDDQLYGDAGNDFVIGGAGADYQHGGDGDDIMGGEDGNDRLDGAAGADHLYGDAGDDFITGGAGSDLLHGGTGDDIMGGEDGDDRLVGADGDDALYGDAGNDTLTGGAGADQLHGGAGADLFVFDTVGERDTVLDFQSGVDRIDLSGIDADSRTADDDAFRFIGTGAFTGAAGELRGETIDGATHLFGDVNGDGVADFTIVLNAAPVPAATDFVL